MYYTIEQCGQDSGWQWEIDENGEYNSDENMEPSETATVITECEISATVTPLTSGNSTPVSVSATEPETNYLWADTTDISDTKLKVYDTENSEWVTINAGDSSSGGNSSASTLEGLTTTVDELNYLSGTTSNVQEQLNNKVDEDEKGVANGIATLDENGKIPTSQLPDGIGGGGSSSTLEGLTATVDELNYMSGATSNIQEQLNNKVETIEGKGLSTNDFTNEYKDKLDNLSTGGEEVTGDYIPASEKGVAGGVATLGEDGKISSGQILKITTSEIDEMFNT